jgi:hypothetical protein
MTTNYVPLDELTRAQLLELLVEQTIFTEGLRTAASLALAHAGHLISNYARDMPDEKLKAWARAQVHASGLLLHRTPVSHRELVRHIQ